MLSEVERARRTTLCLFLFADFLEEASKMAVSEIGSRIPAGAKGLLDWDFQVSEECGP